MLYVHSIACTSNSQQDMQCGYKRNTEERSHNHLCHVISVSVICFEYVSVALVIQNAKRLHCIILSSVAWPALPHFATISHKRRDFGGGRETYWT